MANPAAELRAKAQARWNGASVFARGRNWLKHQHPSNPNQYMLDVAIGPLHISGTETEIDTAWTVGDNAPYRRRMILADYNAYAGLDDAINFDAGQIVRYVHPGSGKGIAFQPQQLQWTNDLNQLQPIAIPQTVGATVSDDVLGWAGAYGAGLDFEWQTQTARLQKRLIVNALANLPAPNSTILSGGNPVLLLSFIFQPDSGVDIFIDNALWNRNANNPQTTSGAIEFRLSATGETLWHFQRAFAWDSAGGAVNAVQRVRRSGNSLFVEVRVPYSWLQTAVYPVTVDPSVDVTIGAAGNDGMWSTWSNSALLTSSTALQCGENGDRVWKTMFLRFTGITIDSGVTIDVAKITMQSAETNTWNNDSTWSADDQSSPAAPSSAADGESRTDTTATVAWNGAKNFTNNTDFDSPSIVSIVQELVDSYTYSSGTMQFLLKDPTATTTVYDRLSAKPYDSDTTYCGRLHIEYTAGGASAHLATLLGVGG